MRVRMTIKAWMGLIAVLAIVFWYVSSWNDRVRPATMPKGYVACIYGLEGAWVLVPGAIKSSNYYTLLPGPVTVSKLSEIQEKPFPRKGMPWGKLVLQCQANQSVRIALGPGTSLVSGNRSYTGRNGGRWVFIGKGTRFIVTLHTKERYSVSGASSIWGFRGWPFYNSNWQTLP